MSYITQLRSLAAYNRWANEQILATSDGLPDDAFAAVDVDGLSLQNALAHAVGTQLWWLSNWTAAPPPSFDRVSTRQGIRDAYDDSHDRIEALIADTDEGGWSRLVDFSFAPGQPLKLPLWQTFSQVMYHGIQHRAEAAVLLTRAGHSPGNMDYILWLLNAGGS